MGRTCLKLAIVIFNVVMMLIGAAALGMGIWVLVHDQDLFDATTDVLELKILGADLLDNCAMTMITAGAVVFALGTLGCIGAFALSSFLLVFYSLCLTVLLTVQVAVVVLAIVFRSELLDQADNNIKDRLIKEYGDKDLTFTKNFDIIQKELDCCGWMSGEDYDTVSASWNKTISAGTERKVPDACCESSNQTLVLDCVVNKNATDIYSNKGCKQEVKDQFEEYIWVIIGLTAGLLGFQFLLISLSLCLVVKNVGKKYDM